MWDSTQTSVHVHIPENMIHVDHASVHCCCMSYMCRASSYRMQKMHEDGCKSGHSAHLGPVALHCWRACGVAAVAVDGVETAASAGGTAAAPAPWQPGQRPATVRRPHSIQPPWHLEPARIHTRSFKMLIVQRMNGCVEHVYSTPKAGQQAGIAETGCFVQGTHMRVRAMVESVHAEFQ